MDKKKKSLLRRMRFKYKLVALNEKTLNEVFHMRISLLSMITLGTLFSFISFALLSLIIFFTPLKHLLPGYADFAVKGDVIATSIQVDSLSTELDVNRTYLALIKKAIIDDISIDSVPEIDSIRHNRTYILEEGFSETEQNFITKYEDKNLYNINNINTKELTKDHMLFAPPIEGSVASSFSPKDNQYGITILSSANRPVLAVAEGKIVLTNYDITGYTIVVQHQNDYLSIYSKTGRLLVIVGDKVAAGQAIAFVNSDNNNSTPLIDFELWHKGNALNPESYIPF